MTNATEFTAQRVGDHLRVAVGGAAWPTVGLFFGLLGAGMINVWLALSGAIALWVGAIVNVVVFYYLEHVNHEAIHSNISGARSDLKWLNDLIGHIGNFWLFLPYPAFKAVHFAHHRSTNHATLDCDRWFARRTRLGVLLSCSTLLIGYEIYLHRLARLGLVERGAMATIYVTRALWVALLAAAFYFGFGYEAFMLWVLPALLAMPVLAFLFAYIVHHPHDSEEIHRASNVWLVRNPILHSIVTAGFLFQNYHLVHHLHPRVPFYRYGAVFRDIRPQLERKGAAIKHLF